MPDSIIPDLRLIKLAYGTHETVIDLRNLLYLGGAAVRRDKTITKINSGELGEVIMDRLPLVKLLHADLLSDISRGLRRSTINNRYKYTCYFYAWCDRNNHPITATSVVDGFYSWVESLTSEIKAKKIKHLTVYRQATAICFLISRALNIKRGLLRNTRLPKPKRNSRALGAKVDKQNLEETFEFGHMLLNIVDCLSAKAIMGKLPLIIHIHGRDSLTEWSSLRPPESVKGLGPETKSWVRNRNLATRAAWEAEKSHRTRFPLINLRIEAEILIFISQTGMNLSQAQELKRGKFRFQSSEDSINVFRVFKNRRQGEAIFKIYKEYGSVFKRYLKWLDEIFSQDEERLFPFITPYAIPREGKSRPFQAIQRRCKQLGIRCVKPLELRNTRINWLLRRGLDPNLTAEMAQHTKETLIRVYESPHHQVAAVEITKFHLVTDPAITPPGPGSCNQLHRTPKTIEGTPELAPQPDCISPAGCMFCFYHRDIDNQDYVWSLASFRYCKRLELDEYVPPRSGIESHPAVLVINRISSKLEAFSVSSEIRAAWVSEAKDRIREGRYHPNFDGLIQLMEMSS